MKKIFQYLVSALVLSILVSSCYYDKVVVYTGVPTNVSFKNDILPILNQHCNTTGCHDATPSHAPSLVEANAYNALILGQYVNTVDPASSKFYKEVEAGSMPPSGALGINQQMLILGWITDGALDN